VGPARAGTLSLSDQGDSKYTRSFDAVFAADGIAAILTRSALRGRTLSPNDGSAPSDVNALTGRSSSVGVTSTGALRDYVAHYNAKRPHRGIDLRAPDSPPDPSAPVLSIRRVRRRDVLGGLIHEYELVA
jgi:hypothetical protein